MTATFVKCPCNHCSGSIEFEESHLDQMATCPHCGSDTILYRPRTEGTPPKIPTDLEYQQALGAIEARRKSSARRRKIAKWIAIGCVVALVTWAVYQLAQTGELGPIMAAAPSGLLGAAIIVLGIWVCVLWIVFPVFVFHYLRELIRQQRTTNQLLKQRLTTDH